MLKKISNRAKVIAISSGKGGVGKSNIATNLGISFANTGKKVCLFDADINLANINILLGVNPDYTLEHLFSENKTIDDIVISDKSGIDIIAGASGVTQFTRLNRQQQQRLLDGLKQLENKYDYLIVDTAAGIDDNVLSFLHAIPYLLLVITKEPTSLTDAFSLLKVLKRQNFKQRILVVVNMVSGLKMAKNIFARFNDAVSKYLQLKLYLAGYIVMDDYLRLAVNQQKPVINHFQDCSASICIDSLGKKLLNVLEASKPAKKPFSDFFKTIIDTSDLAVSFRNESANDLLIKIMNLKEDDQYFIYTELKHKLQADSLTQSQTNSYKKSNNETEFVDSQLTHALYLAARLNSKM